MNWLFGVGALLFGGSSLLLYFEQFFLAAFVFFIIGMFFAYILEAKAWHGSTTDNGVGFLFHLLFSCLYSSSSLYISFFKKIIESFKKVSRAVSLLWSYISSYLIYGFVAVGISFIAELGIELCGSHQLWTVLSFWLRRQSINKIWHNVGWKKFHVARFLVYLD